MLYFHFYSVQWISLVYLVWGFFSLFLLLFVFSDRSLCEAQAGLELSILLTQPPECWDYRCVPLYLASCQLLESIGYGFWDFTSFLLGEKTPNLSFWSSWLSFPPTMLGWASFL
jgi:hypothetical protein